MNALFITATAVYVIYSAKVGSWTLLRRDPYFVHRCPKSFANHPIPFYASSWVSFWAAAALGVLSTVNAYLVGAVLIGAYILSGLLTRLLLARAIAH